ncbi:MAG: hypothetical protein QOJ91_1306 [Sphingomonadales bacterium]|jgi:hypothetical protein|nr:hypothetical protein [Sphingomonadales bacterium]
MGALRSADGLMGLLSLGAALWALWTLRRGLRDGRLPIGRTYVERAERPGPFRLLAILYPALALLLAAMGADLLFNLGLRESL